MPLLSQVVQMDTVLTVPAEASLPARRDPDA